MKFKVGDKVVFTENSGIGKVGVTAEVYDLGTNDMHIYVKDSSDGSGSWAVEPSWIRLVDSKKEKVLPVQYIVIYDFVDRDPAKTFTSRKELNKWLKEAKEDRDVIFSSIKVFEVKREYEVKTSFSLKKK